jgi:hypothetical protein
VLKTTPLGSDLDDLDMVDPMVEVDPMDDHSKYIPCLSIAIARSRSTIAIERHGIYLLWSTRGLTPWSTYIYSLYS